MTEHAVYFDHCIGATVKVLALELTGRVSGMMLDECGPSYRVVYWSDGSRRSEWMYGWEIRAQ